MPALDPLDYISEDDLNTYETWLKFQAIDVSTLTAEEASALRAIFEAAVEARATTQKVGA